MEIRKNKEIGISNDSDTSFKGKKDYIPRLHEDKPDTVELRETNGTQQKKSLSSILSDFKQKLNNALYVGKFTKSSKKRMNSTLPNSQKLTKDDVSAMLDKLKLSDTTKELLLSEISTPEQLVVASSFLSNPKAYNNFRLQDKIDSIVVSTNADNYAIAEKYVSEYEKFGTNVNIEEILNSTKTPEEAQSRYIVMDKFCSDPKLYQNAGMQRVLDGMIYDTKTQEQAYAKLSIIDKFLSDPKLYENESLKRMIGVISFFSQTKENADSKLKLIDKFLSDPRLYKNKDLGLRLGNIILDTQTKKRADLRVLMMDNFLSSPKIYENKRLKEELGIIVSHTQTETDAETQLNKMNRVLTSEQ